MSLGALPDAHLATVGLNVGESRELLLRLRGRGKENVETVASDKSKMLLPGVWRESWIQRHSGSGLPPSFGQDASRLNADAW